MTMMNIKLQHTVCVKYTYMGIMASFQYQKVWVFLLLTKQFKSYS